MIPSRCIFSMVSRAIIAFSPPSGLTQPMARQNARASPARVCCGEDAISARISAISPVVKSRP